MGPKELPVSFMQNVRTKQWISVRYVYVRLCSVTCDMLYV